MVRWLKGSKLFKKKIGMRVKEQKVVNFPISRARCCSLDNRVLGVASNVLLLTVPSLENHISVPEEHYLDRDASDLGGNPSSVISPRAPWSEQSQSRANSSRMPGVHLHSKGLQNKTGMKHPFSPAATSHNSKEEVPH